MYKKIKAICLTGRPQHSIKNLLVFLPLLSSNNFDFLTWKYVFYGFIFLSLISSSTYFINDIIDINYDRLNSDKKKRPIALGHISIIESIFYSLLIIIFSLILSFYLLPFKTIQFFLIYILISLLYSFVIKKIIWIDTFILSSLFTIRILIGNIISDITISFWLLSFCFFFFLMLAQVKRLVELIKSEHDFLPGRGYSKKNLVMIKNGSIISGFIACLIWFFYGFSKAADILYNNSWIISSVAILIMIWIIRIISLASQNKIDYDPILFVIKDKFTYIICFSIFLFFYLQNFIK